MPQFRLPTLYVLTIAYTPIALFSEPLNPIVYFLTKGYQLSKHSSYATLPSHRLPSLLIRTFTREVDWKQPLYAHAYTQP